MFPDDLLEKNRAFAAKRKAGPLPSHSANPIVVTCFDPRLDPLLRPALGLATDKGVFVRTAGAVVTPATLRSLTLAVYMFEVREVLVLGHSTCRMASFSTPDFIESFRGRGVTREAFGDIDLRTWAGATANPRDGVLGSMAAIAAAPFLPKDLLLAGAVLDDETGRIEILKRPGEDLPVTAPAPPATPENVGAGDAIPAPLAAEPTEPAEPPPIPPSLAAVYSAMETLSHRRSMKSALADLRHDLAREQNPLMQLDLIRKFIDQGGASSHELHDALHRARNELMSEGPRYLSQVFQQLLDRAGGER